MEQSRNRSEWARLLQEAAAKAFEQSSGLKATPEPARPDTDPAKGSMRFDLGQKRIIRMPVVIRPRIDRLSAVAALRNLQADLDEQMLVVTDKVSPEMAEQLRANNIPFLDTAGNAYLDLSEVLIYIVGRRQSARSEMPPVRSGSPKQLQVHYALMTRPALVNATYREIAATAHVALSTVNLAIDDLLARRLLIADTDGSRRFGDWDRMVEEWANQYPVRLKTKLPSRRYTSDRKDWWKSSDMSRYDAVFSGEVAAAKLTGHLRPARVTIYASSVMPKELIIGERLRADPHGEIEIFQPFWTGHPEGETNLPNGVAPAVLVYADLLDSGESRNLELARTIRESHLGKPPVNQTKSSD